ncbi:hypothetical protein C8J57DRAFT_1218797 [Mycena rebaudengoi]|nr:hypothetical protein C8J57DRAFT_1218797 [Mycena rebaudengoi]
MRERARPLRQVRLPGELAVDQDIPHDLPPVPVAIVAPPELNFDVVVAVEAAADPVDPHQNTRTRAPRDGRSTHVPLEQEPKPLPLVQVEVPIVIEAPVDVELAFVPVAAPLPERTTSPPPPTPAREADAEVVMLEAALVDIPIEIEAPADVELAYVPIAAPPSERAASPPLPTPAREAEAEATLPVREAKLAPFPPPVIVQIPQVDVAENATFKRAMGPRRPNDFLGTSFRLPPPPALPSIADTGRRPVGAPTAVAASPSPRCGSLRIPAVPLTTTAPLLLAHCQPHHRPTRARRKDDAAKPSPSRPNPSHAQAAAPSPQPFTLADVIPPPLQPVVKREPLSPRVPHANVKRFEDGADGGGAEGGAGGGRGPKHQTDPAPSAPQAAAVRGAQRPALPAGADGHGSAAERGFVRKQAGERVAIDRTQVHISPVDVEVDWRVRQREPSVVQLDRERQLGRYTRGGQASVADRSVLERHLREKVDIHRTQAEIPREDL